VTHLPSFFSVLLLTEQHNWAGVVAFRLEGDNQAPAAADRQAATLVSAGVETNFRRACRFSPENVSCTQASELFELLRQS